MACARTGGVLRRPLWSGQAGRPQARQVGHPMEEWLSPVWTFANLFFVVPRNRSRARGVRKALSTERVLIFLIKLGDPTSRQGLLLGCYRRRDTRKAGRGPNRH